MPGRASGKRGLSLTRPLLEHHVRQHTLAIPNLQVRTSAKVSGLISNGDVVAGVVYQVDSGNTERYKAALVVDAGGRGSKAPAWLDAAGFGKVPRSKVFIDVRYVTCNFTRPPEDLSGFVVRHYPQDKLGAALLPVEDDQWLLSLSGRFGVYAETTLPGFLNSAQSLPISDVYDTIAGQAPTTPVTAYTFARNQFVHYDQLTRVPNGFVALGDSVLSLNPLYGQGMTSAFAQVSLLDETLATLASAGDPVTQTSARFLPQQAAFLDAPWARAMVGDTQFTETRGDLPEDLDLLRARDAALSTLAATDPEIARLLFQVNQFAEPASVLGRDDIEQKVQHILGPD